MGILSTIFKPSPRKQLRALIKQTYGKGEIISLLQQLHKLGDPIALKIGRAAESNNLAEMERLIRNL
jgi:hypothetical protein